MRIFKTESAYKKYLENISVSNKKIGFVPTMGALHEGHLKLIEESKKKSILTVCSIFVNPTQFNNPEDLSKYPITLEADILKLEKAGCDVLFLPDVETIYPNESSRNRHYDLGNLEMILEGAFRPGHFQGVCMVVETLLQIVHPHFLFLGEKDFQQCKVIERLVELKNIPTTIITVPTMREESGLAMSSRNKRLSENEKIVASKLYESLAKIRAGLHAGMQFSKLQAQEITHLEEAGFQVEYLELASAKNLEITSEYHSDNPQLVLIAASLQSVRLIDNLFV